MTGRIITAQGQGKKRKNERTALHVEKECRRNEQMNERGQKRTRRAGCKYVDMKELDLYIISQRRKVLWQGVLDNSTNESTRKRADSSPSMDIAGCSTSSGDAFWLMCSFGIIIPPVASLSPCICRIVSASSRNMRH